MKEFLQVCGICWIEHSTRKVHLIEHCPTACSLYTKFFCFFCLGVGHGSSSCPAKVGLNRMPQINGNCYSCGIPFQIGQLQRLEHMPASTCLLRGILWPICFHLKRQQKIGTETELFSHSLKALDPSGLVTNAVIFLVDNLGRRLYPLQ
jgi:hypothetical protein